MATYSRFEDLPVWQRARDLDKKVFAAANDILLNKDFGLRNQILNASGSIMDNIAEGFERSSRLEFINFLSFAKGSAGEVKSQLYRSLDRNYITETLFTELSTEVDEVCKMLMGFMEYLNTSVHRGQKFKGRT
jgi:four helix bundle protein